MAELLAGYPLAADSTCVVAVNGLQFRATVITVDWEGDRVVVEFAGGQREQFYRLGGKWGVVEFRA